MRELLQYIFDRYLRGEMGADEFRATCEGFENELHAYRHNLAETQYAFRALCASPVVHGHAAAIRDDAARRNDKPVYDIAVSLLRSSNRKLQ